MKNDLDYTRESEFADLTQRLAALGRADEARLLLKRLLEAAESTERQEKVIEYLALQALAFHAQEDTASALACLSRALALAEPEGYVRVFVDEGEPMEALLRVAISRGVAPAYVEKLLAAPKSQPPPQLVEPLTERELEVLRLIADGLKFKEIAEKLVISVNTVRSHAKNIYSKLDVNSRTQATAKARDLNLL